VIAAIRYTLGQTSQGRGQGSRTGRQPGLLARRLAQWQVRCAQVPARVASGSFVRRAHALGLDVHVWTINDRAEMIRLLDLGADGIMTDDLCLLREVLIERGQWHPREP
jgi:glycerophosphoryl diester phosphodiesterase